MIKTVYIVQNLDTYEFLCSDEDSLIGFTNEISKAGFFHERFSAIQSAVEEIGEHFYIFEFLKYVED